MNRFPRTLALALVLSCLTLLAACGGSSGSRDDGEGPAEPAPPQPPTITSYAPAVAARGQSITLSGEEFGDEAGSVTVGGAPATVTAWTDTSVELTIPDGAPNGWQNVALANANGEHYLEGLFVGVEFTGTGPELQGFLDEQSPGTAVLFGAATYDLSGSTAPYVVRDLELHGRGADATQLALGTGGVLHLLAELGSKATLTALEVTGDTVALGTPHLTGSAALADPSATDLRPTAQLTGLTFDQITQQNDSLSARFVIRDVRLAGPRLMNNTTLHGMTFDVELLGSELTGGGVSLYTLGDLLLEDVTIDAPEAYVDLWTTTGSMLIRNSALTFQDAEWGTNAGMRVEDSHLESTKGGLSTTGAAVSEQFGGLLGGAPVVFSGNTIRMLDSDLTDFTLAGHLSLSNRSAPLILENNPVIQVQEDLRLVNIDDNVGAGLIRVVGNGEIRVGISTEEDATHFRAGVFLISTLAPGAPVVVEVSGNQLAVNGAVNLMSDGNHDLRFDDNHGVIGDENTPGALTLSGPTSKGPVTMARNDLLLSNMVTLNYPDLGGATLLFDDNRMRVLGAGPAMAYLDAANGDCRVSGNQVEVEGAGGAAFRVECLSGVELFSVTDNQVTVVNGSGQPLMIRSGSPVTAVTDNVLRNEADIIVFADSPRFEVSQNEFHTLTGQVMTGDLGYSGSAELEFTENRIIQQDPATSGIQVIGIGHATISDNTAMVLGTPHPEAVALAVSAQWGNAQVSASGNTFAGYSRALRFVDAPAVHYGLNVTVTNNVFDFPITASPQVADLRDVGDELDARNNLWGTNSDPADVASYVLLDPGTLSRGGSILLDPITLPPAP